MTISRRGFFHAAAGASAAAIAGRGIARAAESQVSIEALEAAASRPVLRRELFNSPLVIDSIRLLRKERVFRPRSLQGRLRGCFRHQRTGEVPLSDPQRTGDPLFFAARTLATWKIISGKCIGTRATTRCGGSLSGAPWPGPSLRCSTCSAAGRSADRRASRHGDPRDVPFYVASGNRNTAATGRSRVFAEAHRPDGSEGGQVSRRRA